MIGSPSHYPGHHIHHLFRALVFMLLVLLACLILSDTAAGEPFPAVIDLDSLDGDIGFALNGVARSDRAGDSVSGAGDVNGDGLNDLVIGAVFADPRGLDYAGESYVVFGRATVFPSEFELKNLHPALGGDGSEGSIVQGVDSDDYSGGSVGGACDVNGDGHADLIIGASLASANLRIETGETYVVFGQSMGFPAVFRLHSLKPVLGGDGSEGFILMGVNDGDHSGGDVSCAGDVNADGIDDLIIGASDAGHNGEYQAGESYVVFGRTTGFPAIFDLSELFPPRGGDGSDGFVLKGIHAEDWAGKSVSDAGDINGDGISDLIIGASRGDPNGLDRAGESYVLFGRLSAFPAIIDLSHLHPALGGDGTEGFIINGINSGDEAGLSVGGVGDVNDDGIDDVVICASRDDRAGESYVLFGRSTGFPAIFELSTLHPDFGGNGAEGFIVEGFEIYDGTELAVGGASDINGDGIDDIVIGAAWARGKSGDVYVIFGQSEAFPATFALADLFPDAGGDGSSGFVLQGDSSERAGVEVSGTGDVNGDGIDDLVIGAWGSAPNNLETAGRAYVLFGRVAETP